MQQGRWGEGRTLTVTARENGETLVMRSGETLRVVLSANAGTGFSWDLDRVERTLIEPLGGEIRHAPGQPLPNGTALPLAGGPQQITVLFRVLRPGRSAVTLKLWRPWEGEGSIVERFRVVVVAVGS
jgi:predicted secreted protein